MKHLYFWKGMEEVSFKRTDEGDVFYPYGAFGAGYVVNDAQKAELSAAIRGSHSHATGLLIAGAFAGGFRIWTMLPLLLLGIVAMVIHGHRRFRKILVGAPRSRHRLRLAETQRATAERISNARLITALVINAGFVAACSFLLLLMLAKYDQTVFLISIGGLLFFGLLTLLGARIAWLKWGHQST